jgi:hypothetical protein
MVLFALGVLFLAFHLTHGRLGSHVVHGFLATHVHSLHAALQGVGRVDGEIGDGAEEVGVEPVRFYRLRSLASYRIKALEGSTTQDSTREWAWPTVASAAVPLALSLALTLVLHLSQVLAVAGAC